MKFALRNFVAAVLAAGAGAAQAADLPSSKDAPAAPAMNDWFVTFSGQVSFGPSYPGARRYEFYGLPGIGLRRVGEVEPFSTPDEGFSLALYTNGWLRAGAVGRVIGDRETRNDASIRGLPYIPYSVELGGFAEVTPVSWGRLRVELRQGVTGHDGLTATAGGDVWQKWNHFTLSVGPRLYFGNDQYASTYFSVTPAQVALNAATGNGDLFAYRALGGLTGAGATAALRYDISEDWRVTGFGNYQRLVGSVANSPLANRAGDSDQWTYGLELAYRFHTTGQIIPGLF